MPTYVYRCENEHVTEHVLPMADEKPASVPCATPKCAQEAVRVFVAPVAVHWDGSGGSYHEDTYRNDSGRYGWKRRENAADDLPKVNL